MSSNSVSNHTLDKQIGLLLRGRPILLISHIITDQIRDFTQSYYQFTNLFANLEDHDIWLAEITQSNSVISNFLDIECVS